MLRENRYGGRNRRRGTRRRGGGQWDAVHHRHGMRSSRSGSFRDLRRDLHPRPVCLLLIDRMHGRQRQFAGGSGRTQNDGPGGRQGHRHLRQFQGTRGIICATSQGSAVVSLPGKDTHAGGRPEPYKGRDNAQDTGTLEGAGFLAKIRRLGRLCAWQSMESKRVSGSKGGSRVHHGSGWDGAYGRGTPTQPVAPMGSILYMAQRTSTNKLMTPKVPNRHVKFSRSERFNLAHVMTFA